MHKTKFKNIKFYAFILIELILCLLVQTTSTLTNIVVSYSAIIIAFIYCLSNFNLNKAYILTLIGLLGTVFADFFLVVLEPRNQILAMIFFNVTQICYFIRLYLNHDTTKEKQNHLIIRSITILISVTATILVLKNNTDLLSIISLIYYANLIINTVYAFKQFKISKVFAVGLLCFCLCDLFIGFSILDQSYITIQENSLLYFLCHPGFNIAWLFYIPSQTFISLSTKKVLDTSSN